MPSSKVCADAGNETENAAEAESTAMMTSMRCLFPNILNPPHASVAASTIHGGDKGLTPLNRGVRGPRRCPILKQQEDPMKTKPAILTLVMSAMLGFPASAQIPATGEGIGG